jgi:hypothetical protein
MSRLKVKLAKRCSFDELKLIMFHLLAPATWGTVLEQAVQKEELSVMPYELQLDYDYWSYRKCFFCPRASLWSRSS